MLSSVLFINDQQINVVSTLAQEKSTDCLHLTRIKPKIVLFSIILPQVCMCLGAELFQFNSEIHY